MNRTKMIFQADTHTAKKAFRKYKLIFYALLAFLLNLCLAYIVPDVQRHHTGMAVLMSIVSAFVCRASVYSGYRGAYYFNRTIKSIEIKEEAIQFTTFDAMIYFGLVRLKGFTEEVPRNLAEFALAPEKHRLGGISRSDAGDQYLLSYAGDVYLILSNFFTASPELKRLLDSYCAAGSEPGVV